MSSLAFLLSPCLLPFRSSCDPMAPSLLAWVSPVGGFLLSHVYPARNHPASLHQASHDLALQDTSPIPQLTFIMEASLFSAWEGAPVTHVLIML